VKRSIIRSPWVVATILCLGLLVSALLACEVDDGCEGTQTRCTYPGETEGYCVDLQSDQYNCGGCNVSCDTGQVCTAGTCTEPDGG